MLILVAVAGPSSVVAQALAEALSARGAEVVRLAPLLVEQLTPFDGVVVGSAVYLGRWLPSAHSLLQRCAPELRDKPLWLLSSGWRDGAWSPSPVRPGGSARLPEAVELGLGLGARRHWVLSDPTAQQLLQWGADTVARVVSAPAAGHDAHQALEGPAEEIVAELSVHPAAEPATGPTVEPGLSAASESASSSSVQR